jgi:hypothetical protein
LKKEKEELDNQRKYGEERFFKFKKEVEKSTKELERSKTEQSKKSDLKVV